MISATPDDITLLAHELRSRDQRGCGRVERLELGAGTIDRLTRLEAAADMVRAYDLQVVPALLQLPAYSLGVIKGVDARVGENEARTRMLLKSARAEFFMHRAEHWRLPRHLGIFIVGELALTRPWAPAAHAAQLRRLLEITARDAVMIRILPLEVLPPLTDSHFTLYTQGRLDDEREAVRRVVYSEQANGGYVYTRVDDTIRMQNLFADLVTLSLPPAESAQRIGEELSKWTTSRVLPS